MDRRLLILRSIDENPRISQRKLAKSLALSLGTINAMMQQLEEAHLITATHINGKSTEYLVTESGRVLKAELSRVEAIHCYQFIGETKSVIKENMEKVISEGINKFAFYGEEDEIFKLLKMTFFDLKRFHDLTYIVTKEEPVEEAGQKIIVWDIAKLTKPSMVHILLEA